MVIEHYEPGERVLAFTGEGTYSDPANWKPGVVSRDEPYPHAHTGGAFVMWDLPPDTPSWVSRGGWKSQNSIQRVDEQAKCQYCGASILHGNCSRPDCKEKREQDLYPSMGG